MWPREHGSWAMLAAPAVVGWAAAGGGPAGAGVLFAAALLGAFLSRTPVTALCADPRDARAWRWFAACAALGAAGLAGLLGTYGRWGLMWLALPGAAVFVASLWFTVRRKAMTEAHELLGVAGLSLGAPGAAYAATGAWTADSLWLWALCALFFSGPVYHVKMLVAGKLASVPSPAPGALVRAERAAAQSASYHIATAALVGGGVAWGCLPAAALIPFLGVLGKTLYYGSRRGGRLELKKVGWQEVAWTAVFVVVSAASFRT